MPNFRRNNPDIVARFALQELTKNEKWVEIHGKRTFEDVRVTPKNGEVFAVISTMPQRVVLHAGVPQIISKLETKLDVVSVRQFPTGKATWFDFEESYYALMDALCGHNGLEVFNANGDLMGEIWQSMFVGEIKRSHSTGNYDVLHRGATIQVIHN